MNSKKYINIGIILLSMVLLTVNTAMAVDYDRENLYVTDRAGVLSDETIEHIIDINKALKDTGSEIAVLTLESLDGQDIKSLATEVFEDWGVGDNKKDNGLLIVLALDERSVEVEVGYGLEGAIPDSKVVRILKEDFAPSAGDNDFDRAILNTFDSYVKEIMKEYDIESLDNIEIEEKNSGINFPTIIFLFIMIIIIVTIIFNAGDNDDDNFRGGGSGGNRYPRGRVFWGGSMGRPGGRWDSGGFGGSSGGSNGGFGGGRSGGGGGGINFCY